MNIVFATVLALVTFAPAPTAAPVMPSLTSIAPVPNFNEIAQSRSTAPEVVDWFALLIALNPTALVATNGAFISVTSATNTALKLPAGPIPAGVSVTRV